RTEKENICHTAYTLRQKQPLDKSADEKTNQHHPGAEASGSCGGSTCQGTPKEGCNGVNRNHSFQLV
ncbi:MAG: hypothetical protein VYA11_05670, partial [Planctomycetota bacterium]|nr:hypothetical protein [Planctomycetota bacterium]